MKVNVGVVGRFHAFDLALQLKKHKVLNKMITSYPSFLTNKWGFEKREVINEPILEVINRYKDKVPFFKDEYLNLFIQKKHAINCAEYLDECDIFIGWSGNSLEALIEAKKKGKLTVLERGSSHFSFQMKILQESNPSFIPNYSIWQRELLEYELADYISIPSSFVKRTFLEHGIEEKKLLVNPYGVDLTDFKQIEKEDNVFRIVYTGAGTIQKGYHLLLQAFFELNLENCELWHLGSITEEIKPFLKKYKHKNWLLKGHIPQNNLYKYYSQGNVFILPSLQDGFGMVLTQAMSCGLPVICTTNTGGMDLISEDGEEGFVLPIQDIDALKEKILFLYKNRKRCEEMGLMAKEKVSNDFSWDDYGDRYMKNLEKICK